MLPRVIHDDLRGICERTSDGLARLAGTTVLITGGAGFLPSYLVDALAHANDTVLSEPCRILCVDNFITGVASRLEHLAGRDDVVFVTQDVSRAIELSEPVDFMVHGAGIASPTWYRRYPLETIDVNVNGTRNMLELARENAVKGFIYLSSSEIYGDPPPERVPTTEDYRGNVSSTGPRACYDESKRLGETICVSYHQLYGTPVKIVRPFNVYGPRLRLDDGRVIPDFMRDALERRPITLYSDGRVTRSFCYIADFVAGMILLLVADAVGEAYNLGNDEEVTIARVAEMVDEATGLRLGVRYATSADPVYLTDNPSRRSPNLDKVKDTVDWHPVIDLREGLRRTYDSYREVAER